MNAIRTQTDTATLIVGAGGDYVFTIEANQPTLCAQCKALPWKNVASHSSVQTGHGRGTHRAKETMQ